MFFTNVCLLWHNLNVVCTFKTSVSVISTLGFFQNFLLHFLSYVQNIFFTTPDYGDLCFFSVIFFSFYFSCFECSYVTIFHVVHPLYSVTFVMLVYCLLYIFSSFFLFLFPFFFCMLTMFFPCMTVFEPGNFTQLCQTRNKEK